MSGFGLDPVPGMEEAPVVSKLVEPAAKAVGLKVLNGPKAGTILPLELPLGVIGRNDPPSVTVDIDLTDAELGSPPMTSRRHARFERDSVSGDVFLIDLGSTNGTWVGLSKLQPMARSEALQVPARIKLGNLEFDIIYVGD